MLHKSTSPFPILSALEISQTPPVDLESTLAYKFSFVTNYLNSYLADKLGNFTMDPALNPVPKLEGQVKINPKWSFLIKEVPSVFNDFSTSLQALINLATTALMSFPSGVQLSIDPYMLTIFKWSSSPTQTNKFSLSLWKIPLASGQCLPIPEANNKVLSGS